MSFCPSTIRHLTILILICLLGASACYGNQSKWVAHQVAGVEILTIYNDDTQTTFSVLHSVRISISETADLNHLSVNASAEYPGRKPSLPKNIQIGFDIQPCHTRREPEVRIWADGNLVCSGRLFGPACTGNTKRESEYGTIEVPFKDFVRITEATRIQVHLGEHHFELNDDARKGFQSLIQFLRGG